MLGGGAPTPTQAMEDTTAAKNLIIAFVFVFIGAAALIIVFAVIAYLTRDQRRAAAAAATDLPVVVVAPPAVRLLGRAPVLALEPAQQQAYQELP